MATARPQHDVVRDYLSWLRERLKVIERDDVAVLSTPFLESFPRRHSSLYYQT